MTWELLSLSRGGLRPIEAPHNVHDESVRGDSLASLGGRTGSALGGLSSPGEAVESFRRDDGCTLECSRGPGDVNVGPNVPSGATHGAAGFRWPSSAWPLRSPPTPEGRADDIAEVYQRARVVVRSTSASKVRVTLL